MEEWSGIKISGIDGKDLWKSHTTYDSIKYDTHHISSSLGKYHTIYPRLKL